MHMVVMHLEIVVVDIRQLLEEEGELDAGLVILSGVPVEAGIVEGVGDFIVDHYCGGVYGRRRRV